MKIRLSELRRIIREELGGEPTPDEAMFYSILNNIADDNGGVLPVTHESLRENLESIRRNGIRQQPDSHGIYFRIGWYDSPAFIDPKRAVMVRVGIPKRFLDSDHIIPDDRYGSGYEGFYNFMEENPDVVGGDVGTTFESIPKNWIKSVG